MEGMDDETGGKADSASDPATLRRLAAECRVGIGLRDVADALDAAAEIRGRYTQERVEYIAATDRVSALTDHCNKLEAMARLAADRRDAARAEADQLRKLLSANADTYHAQRQELAAMTDSLRAVRLERDRWEAEVSRLRKSLDSLESDASNYRRVLNTEDRNALQWARAFIDEEACSHDSGAAHAIGRIDRMLASASDRTRSAPGQSLDLGADLTPEQLDGMDMWDRDVMLVERHRAAGAMLVRRAVAEIRRRRAQTALTADEVLKIVRNAFCEADGLAGHPDIPRVAARIAKDLDGRSLERRHVGDGCQFCRGTKGGTPGNENVVGGVVVCDYCTSLIMDMDKARGVPAEHWYEDDGDGGCLTCGQPYTCHHAIEGSEPAQLRCRPTAQPAALRADEVRAVVREALDYAVEKAVDAALGEVSRQVGDMGHVLKEARWTGLHPGAQTDAIAARVAEKLAGRVSSARHCPTLTEERVREVVRSAATALLEERKLYIVKPQEPSMNDIVLEAYGDGRACDAVALQGDDLQAVLDAIADRVAKELAGRVVALSADERAALAAHAAWLKERHAGTTAGTIHERIAALLDRLLAGAPAADDLSERVADLREAFIAGINWTFSKAGIPEQSAAEYARSKVEGGAR